MISPFASSESSSTARNLAGEISSGADPDLEKIRVSLDLAAASRWHLSFLKTFDGSDFLRHRPTLLRSVRRYEALWMPLASELSGGRGGSSPSPMLLLPPLDVQWIWHCHCLCTRNYRDYCLSRFGALVERPAIFDEENEDYAYGRCREVWTARYPSEPFDLEAIAPDEVDDDGGGFDSSGGDGLLAAVERHRDLYSSFCDPFVSETVYLISARRRYREFLYLCGRLADGRPRLIPASDILLMWLTHKSFPVIYERDMEAMGLVDLEKRAAGFGDPVRDDEVEETKKVWEEAFGEPCEMTGACLQPAKSPSRVFFYWDASDSDVNRKYKVLHPRFILEVLVFLKGSWEEGKGAKDSRKTSLHLRTIRCHRELKLEMPVSGLSSTSWQKAWDIYCEFGTRGLTLQLRRQGSSCLQSSKVIKNLVFRWNDLLRSTSLSLSKELEVQLKAMVSVTPPVQAPYLLKCVPDRVTDDSGAMISDEILRMNGYHPQKGRWLSRTVLDQGRRECFVIRIRVGEGFWRRGAETPRAVNWEDRIIEVCEGPWTYVASSVGKSPKKVVGTAIPKEKDTENKKLTWCLSTGDLLTIQLDGGLRYQFENQSSYDSIMLMRGRKLQYQVEGGVSGGKNFEKEEDHYATLVRYTPENPNGKATALINWRLFAVEFLPEEDAVLVLLICTAIIRSISEITREDVGRFLLRKRVKEAKSGMRDWGSVMLPSSSSPHLSPWFWNAAEVLASAEVTDARQPSYWYSASDGKEEMYRQVIIP